MKKLHWDESFSVHVPELDLQHQKLFDLINRLYETWEKGRNDASPLSAITERSMQYKVIDELIEYSVYHFETEEKYMEQSQYAGLDSQKEEHGKFVDEVNRMKQEFTSGETVETVDLIRFLIEWLKRHILVKDKLYDPTS